MDCNNQNHYEDLIIYGRCITCGREWRLGSKAEKVKSILDEASKIVGDIVDDTKKAASGLLTDEELDWADRQDKKLEEGFHHDEEETNQ